MGKKQSLLLIFLFLLFFLSVPIHAQEPIEYPAEGITLKDLGEDLEAENLPNDGLPYYFEQMTDNVKRLFQINADQRSRFERQYLHKLDRKLAACAEIGEKGCADKILGKIKKNQEIAQDAYKEFQQNDEELKTFVQWREERSKIHEGLLKDLSLRKENKDYFWFKRINNRKKAIERREESLKELANKNLVSPVPAYPRVKGAWDRQRDWLKSQAKEKQQEEKFLTAQENLANFLKEEKERKLEYQLENFARRKVTLYGY